MSETAMRPAPVMVIADAIDVLCSDGNASAIRVAADVEAALIHAGYAIVLAPRAPAMEA